MSKEKRQPTHYLTDAVAKRFVLTQLLPEYQSESKVYISIS
ncbi:MAG: hypothetical protein AB4426_12795 [Xenococcaceae cyanobacterium]